MMVFDKYLWNLLPIKLAHRSGLSCNCREPIYLMPESATLSTQLTSSEFRLLLHLSHLSHRLQGEGHIKDGCFHEALLTSAEESTKREVKIVNNPQ